MPKVPRRSRKKFIFPLIVLLCVILVTVYVGEGEDGPLHTFQSFVVDIMSPIGAGFTKIFVPIRDGFTNLTHLPSLARENMELREENAKLKKERLEAKNLERELEELKELVKWSGGRPEFESLAAHVIGLSPSNWQRLLILDAGSSSGVKKYMAVVTEEGLVGRVISVGSISSLVQLVTDSSSSVGARVQRSGELGVVEGRNENVLRLVPMNEEADVRVGDVVETSGLGGTCPSGIAIGKVTKVKMGPYGILRWAEVEPYVKFSKLDNVLVIIMPEPESVILKKAE